MGTAEASEGIIHYLPKEIFSGIVINMQTMYMAANAPEIGDSIRTEKKITDDTKAALVKAVKTFKETFATSSVKE